MKEQTIEKIAEKLGTPRAITWTYVKEHHPSVADTYMERAKEIYDLIYSDIEAEIRKQYDIEVASLKAEIQAMNGMLIDEVWYWQGDGEDKVESLTCPILIRPEDFLEHEAEIRRDERERFLLFLDKVIERGELSPLKVVRNGFAEAVKNLEGGSNAKS